MCDSEDGKTVILSPEDSDLISEKLSAVNNEARFSILKILRDFDRENKLDNGEYKKEPLYSRQINSLLLKNYNINISTQMLGQHIKQLSAAGFVKEMDVRTEVPNKVGPRAVKGYVLREDAFEDLFLDINFLADELLTFFDLYKTNKRFLDDEHCVLTIFNGHDKGKTFKVNKDETVLIGRKGNFNPGDLAAFTILLDNSYLTVSGVSKPHLKLFYKKDGWYILDEESSNGTYIADREVPKGRATKLSPNSFIKLSKGRGGAVIYCSF